MHTRAHVRNVHCLLPTANFVAEPTRLCGRFLHNYMEIEANVIFAHQRSQSEATNPKRPGKAL